MTNLFERSFLLALGAAVITKEMAESAAKELMKKGEASSDEGRRIVEETVAQAKEETRTLKTRLDETLKKNFHDAGLVTFDQLDDLKLKIAQLEHRIALLEAESTRTRMPPAEAGHAGEMPGGEPPASASEEYHHLREEEAEKEALNPHLDVP